MNKKSIDSKDDTVTIMLLFALCSYLIRISIVAEFNFFFFCNSPSTDLTNEWVLLLALSLVARTNECEGRRREDQGRLLPLKE